MERVFRRVMESEAIDRRIQRQPVHTKQQGGDDAQMLSEIWDWEPRLSLLTSSRRPAEICRPVGKLNLAFCAMGPRGRRPARRMPHGPTTEYACIVFDVWLSVGLQAGRRVQAKTSMLRMIHTCDARRGMPPRRRKLLRQPWHSTTNRDAEPSVQPLSTEFQNFAIAECPASWKTCRQSSCVERVLSLMSSIHGGPTGQDKRGCSKT